MTKKKPVSEQKKRGRKSLYNPEFHPQKAGELALMGKTNPEIGEVLGVSVETLNEWRKQYPEFSEAIKGNKDQADAPVVKSLYQRALGYEYKEIKVIETPDGKRRKEVTVKKVAPDVTAQIFWLKNRQPKDWRDKHDQEITGKDGGPVLHEYRLVKGVDPPVRK
ncbi:MAG: helix-turn-helix domain-containing protein [Minisyncoccales bacterium]